MLTYDFEQSIGYWLFMTHQTYERALIEELTPHGITYRQCQVLAWLVHEGDLAQTELAERMRIEPPTLVGILDRMEREGWIVRCSCPGDRRRKLVRPGPEAEPHWARIVACLKKVRAKATHGLSPEQQQSLIELLSTVQENLRPQPQQAAGPSSQIPPRAKESDLAHSKVAASS